MIADIVEEHLDEVVALIERRQIALRTLDLTRTDLADLDRRLLAHFDGLVLGGDPGWEISRPFLFEGGVGEAYVGATLAMVDGQRSRLELLEQALDTPSDDISEGIRLAFCLSGWSGVDAYLSGLLMDGRSGTTRALALDALVFRRVDPGSAIESAVRTAEGPLLAAGVRGAGVFRRDSLLAAVEAYATANEPELSPVALESLALLDVERCRRRCNEILAAVAPCAADAAVLLGIIGRQEDLDPLRLAANSEDFRLARSAVLALGNLGRVSTVPDLIQLLRRPDLAGVAGVALERILGGSLPFNESTAAPPQVESSDADESASWTPDDDLRKYSAVALEDWWELSRSNFPDGTRIRRGETFRAGQPTASTPLGLLHCDALELAVESAGQPPLQTSGLSDHSVADSPTA